MCTVAVTAPSVRTVSLAFVVCCCFTFLSLRFTSTRSALECDALPAHELDNQHTFMILRKKKFVSTRFVDIDESRRISFQNKMKEDKSKNKPFVQLISDDIVTML